MATYGIHVYDFDHTSADMQAVKRVLDKAGLEVFDFDPESIQIFVNAYEVPDAVQALNDAGFITDEDEVED